ncbi:unnamed protein product [Closterium sp. Yama58-4]|nr:unnamed protein product [Closterium sp. Yama58-4]
MPPKAPITRGRFQVIEGDQSDSDIDVSPWPPSSASLPAGRTAAGAPAAAAGANAAETAGAGGAGVAGVGGAPSSTRAGATSQEPRSRQFLSGPLPALDEGPGDDWRRGQRGESKGLGVRAAGAAAGVEADGRSEEEAVAAAAGNVGGNGAGYAGAGRAVSCVAEAATAAAGVIVVDRFLVKDDAERHAGAKASRPGKLPSRFTFEPADDPSDFEDAAPLPAAAYQHPTATFSTPPSAAAAVTTTSAASVPAIQATPGTPSPHEASGGGAFTVHRGPGGSTGRFTEVREGRGREDGGREERLGMERVREERVRDGSREDREREKGKDERERRRDERGKVERGSEEKGKEERGREERAREERVREERLKGERGKEARTRDEKAGPREGGLFAREVGKLKEERAREEKRREERSKEGGVSRDMSNQPSGRASLPSVHSLPSTILSAPARSSASSAAAVSDALIAVPHLRSLLKHASEQQEVLFTLIKELSEAHPEIKNPEQSAALLGRIKVELPSERERELMQRIAEMRCKVATLVDNVITYRNRNAQLEKQVAAFQQRKEERERQGVVLRRGR